MIAIPKDRKNILMSLSGGADSAILLYLTAKNISENNIETKITPYTCVEHFRPGNDWNASKIIDIVKGHFPNVSFEEHIVEMIPDDYDRGNKTSKVAHMREMVRELISTGKYDLYMGGISSFPSQEELDKNPKLKAKAGDVGPEDRSKNRTHDNIDWPHSEKNKTIMLYFPFRMKDKKDLAAYYEEYGLHDLLKYTASCVGWHEYTNNFTEPCKECFWCLEKYWAFGVFDWPLRYLK